MIKLWLEALNDMKKQSKKTLDDIALSSGVPKGTLNKLFSGQTKDPQLTTIKSVVHCLGYTLDDLFDDSKVHKQQIIINKDILDKYNNLDPHGKKIVNSVLKLETERIEEEQQQKEQSTNSNNIVEMQNEEASNNDFIFKEIARDTYGTKQKYNTELDEETTESLKNLRRMGKQGEFNVDDHDI